MIHMAQGTVSLMEAATGNKIPSIINRQNLENISSATSKDSVTYFITLSYDYAIEALQHFEMSTTALNANWADGSNLNTTRYQSSVNRF